MNEVNTEPGPRRQLLILHGMIGCRAEMQPWKVSLEDTFETEVLNLAGHGGREIPDRLTMARYADDLLGQMDQWRIEKPVILGYSFGGLVALYLAIHHPDRVSAVVTLATRWLYDAKAVRHMAGLMQVSSLTSSAHRSEHFTKVHYPNDWRMLAQRLSAMYLSFEHEPPVTTEELGRIVCPCLVLSGATDPIAGADETVALHHSLPDSEIAMYHGVAHPPDRVPVGALQRAVVAWAARHLAG